MPVPTLNAKDPSSKPALVYDKLWVEEINIWAPNPNGDANGRVRLRKFAEDEDGNKVLADAVEVIHVNGLMAREGQDPDLDALLQHLMAYIAKLAIVKGLMDGTAPNWADTLDPQPIDDTPPPPDIEPDSTPIDPEPPQPE